MMRFKIFVIFCIFMISPSHGRSVFDSEDDGSVVSVYTTLPTTAGTAAGSFDVYHQIANNIAEKITSPIYRFLGIGKNDSNETNTHKNSQMEKIEFEDEVPDISVKPLEVVDNDISKGRDVEELSSEATRRLDKKPEKIILYSSYLPANVKTQYQKLFNLNDSTTYNETINEISKSYDDNGFDPDFDDDDEDGEEKPRQGAFTYFLEWISSFFQLAWGALSVLFMPRN